MRPLVACRFRTWPGGGKTASTMRAWSFPGSRGVVAPDVDEAECGRSMNGSPSAANDHANVNVYTNFHFKCK